MTILATLRDLRGDAEALGCQAACVELEAMATGRDNHSNDLRAGFQRAGSIEGIVDAAVECFRDGAG